MNTKRVVMAVGAGGLVAALGFGGIAAAQAAPSSGSGSGSSVDSQSQRSDVNAGSTSGKVDTRADKAGSHDARVASQAKDVRQTPDRTSQSRDAAQSGRQDPAGAKDNGSKLDPSTPDHSGSTRASVDHGQHRDHTQHNDR